jgi:hypothetical protein
MWKHQNVAEIPRPEPSGPARDSRKLTPRRLRLPRFLIEEPVGLGQVVKHVTKAVGVRPCDPCERRAEVLDGWIRLEPWQ